MPNNSLIKPTIPTSWRFNSNAQQLDNNALAVLNTEPVELTASENMQRFVLSPAVSNISASKASLTLSVDANLDYNIPAVIVINGAGIVARLTASNTPSFNEFFSDNGFTLLDRMQLAQAIAYELQNNLAFSNFYTVRASNTQIIIDAIDFGAQYDLTYTLPLNMSLVSNVGGQYKYSYNVVQDYTAFTEYYVGSGVYGENVDKLDFFQVGSIDVPFDNDIIKFNTNGAVKNYVDLQFPTKKLNQTFSVNMLDDEAILDGKDPILRPYFVVFGDSFRYISNGEKKRIVNCCSSIRWVQNAAQHKLDAYNLANYVWNPNSTFQFQFLTDRPDYIPVTYNSHQFLQVILKRTPQAKGSYWLEVKTKFYDGTSLTTIYGGAGQSFVGLYGNLSFDVSPDTLNLSGIETAEGKLIDTYEVSLLWTTSPGGVTQYRSYPVIYTMFRRCNDHSLNLVWFNKFGAWDSLEFNGTQSVQTTRSKSEIVRTIPYEANLRIGSTMNSLATDDEITLTYDITTNNNYTVESGLLDRAHYAWLQGLLNSTSVITFNKEQRRFRAIIIDSYDFNWNTDQTEFNMVVTFRYTVDNNTINR